MSSVGQYTLETPESVEVSFELAGAGSRFCAVLVDWALIFLALFCLVAAGCVVNLAGAESLFDNWMSGNGASDWVSWTNAILVILVFVITSGYYIFFELIMRGQTPGKRSLKIRTIRDDGTPVGGNEVVIRNLVRIVDFMPAFYMLGGVAIVFSPTHKRLGDIAAGTIVVKERELDYRGMTDKKAPVAPAAPEETINPELTVEERRLLVRFLQRRQELLPQARRELAERLAEPLHEKYGGQMFAPEAYLEQLIQRRPYGSDTVRS